MSMKNTLLAGAAAAVLLGGTAMADEPVTLTDTQMDDVTAGFLFAFGSTGGFGFTVKSFWGNGAADVTEKSSTEQTETATYSETPTSESLSESANASASAEIKGTFGGLGYAVMETGGTLAFSGNL